MDELNQIAETVASTIGVETASLLGILALVSMIARFVGKAIPDDQTGLLGFVRVVCKILGLYASNRVTSGVSVSDVAATMLDSRAPGSQKTVEQTVRSLK